MSSPSSSNEWISQTEFNPLQFCHQDAKLGLGIHFWHIKNSQTGEVRRVAIHVPPEACPEFDEGDYERHPVLLAFHGSMGGPVSEIEKFSDVASKHGFIVVAPEGSSREGSLMFSWNAIECCGAAVVDQVDDIGFASGVVEAIAATLPMADATTVVATGFSNGGFLASLLGLHAPRPLWLKGIIPTSGYQYDERLYEKANDPLPMFALHGGSDSVVRPEGCCAQGNKPSNCLLDVGMERETCVSVEDAFSMWADINGCEGEPERTTENGASCIVGKACLSATKSCVWPNDDHTWGDNLPGADMVGDFLEMIRAPSNFQYDNPAGSSSKVGLVIFLAFAVALLSFLAKKMKLHRMRKGDKAVEYNHEYRPDAGEDELNISSISLDSGEFLASRYDPDRVVGKDTRPTSSFFDKNGTEPSPFNDFVGAENQFNEALQKFYALSDDIMKRRQKSSQQEGSSTRTDIEHFSTSAANEHETSKCRNVDDSMELDDSGKPEILSPPKVSSVATTESDVSPEIVKKFVGAESLLDNAISSFRNLAFVTDAEESSERMDFIESSEYERPH